MSEYVIVGGSIAGIGAVEAIREVDPVGTIAVITEERFSYYSRPMISDFVCGDATLEKMKYRNDDFWNVNLVQLFAGRTAVGIDFKRKLVKLDDEKEISYKKLLIATGAKPFVPKIKGSDKDGVFTFTTFSDAKRLTSKIKEATKGVVIGGGLIGVSIAEALNRNGLEVTIVELKDRILNLFLDEKASNIAETKIQKAGVRIVTGHTVKRILGRETNQSIVGGVVLTNDERIDCEIVVIAIGVIPRTELVKDSKLKINMGIVVDKFMRTNIPDIYACGDIAEMYDFINGDSRSLPLWPLAHLGGRVAGYNMAAKRTHYPGGTAMNALKYFDLPIISIGIARPNPNDKRYEILTYHDSARNVYKKIVLKKDIVVGMTFVNEIERAGTIFHLMRNHIDVKKFKSLLVSDNFSLATLPSNLRTKLFTERPRW